jgi:uncharacterized membrane protein YfcA
MLTELEILALGVIGVFAGFMNVIAGGGSLLTVPALILFGLPGPVANGTNRIAIIAQTVVATTAYFRRGIHNLKLSITLSLALLPGAIMGGYWGTRIEGALFNRMLAILMIGVMLTMAFEKQIKNRRELPEGANTLKRPLLVYFLISILGFYGGTIHIGIGFFIMAILHRIGQLDLLETNMHKMAIVIPYSLVVLLIFRGEVGVAWSAGIALAVGNSLGGLVGVRMSVKRGEKYIKNIFYFCISILILRLLLG